MKTTILTIFAIVVIFFATLAPFGAQTDEQYDGLLDEIDEITRQLRERQICSFTHESSALNLNRRVEDFKKICHYDCIDGRKTRLISERLMCPATIRR